MVDLRSAKSKNFGSFLIGAGTAASLTSFSLLTKSFVWFAGAAGLLPCAPCIITTETIITDERKFTGKFIFKIVNDKVCLCFLRESVEVTVPRFVFIVEKNSFKR